MKCVTALLIAIFSLAAGGCATITGSEMQQVALSVKDANGAALEGVKCSLKNDKGAWEATAPVFVDIRRSAEDLNVECKKSGAQDGLLKAISRASGGMMGNILFGGGIGALIDHNKGTGYNYPDSLPVEMGKVVVVDRRNQTDVQTQATPSSTPQTAASTSVTSQPATKSDSPQNPLSPEARKRAEEHDAWIRSVQDLKAPGPSN